MEVIEALRISILEPRDHFHINQKRTFTPNAAMHRPACRAKALADDVSGGVADRVDAGWLGVSLSRLAGPAWRYALRRWMCSFRKLWAAAASSHSLLEASRPRRDIVVSFWQVLIWPDTGSTVWARSL